VRASGPVARRRLGPPVLAIRVRTNPDGRARERVAGWLSVPSSDYMVEQGLTGQRFQGIVELRQYTLHPGRRDDLIDVFEEFFIESQEDCGIDVGGLFRDQGDANRFVWMRGFRDLEDRTRALESFYGGPVWAEHRDRANATMIDSDDVLLLQPCGFRCDRLVEVTATAAAISVRAVAGIWVSDRADNLDQLATSDVHDLLRTQLQTCLGLWRSHPGPNDFPALPIRDEHAVVWLAVFPDPGNCSDAMERLHCSLGWQQLEERLSHAGTTYQELPLLPTDRSRHQWMLRAFHPDERNARDPGFVAP